MDIPKKVLEDLESYDNTDTVVVIEIIDGVAVNVKSNNSCARIYIVDHDNVGMPKNLEDGPSIEMHTWPDTQI